MKNETDELKRVFRGILLLLAVPAAGCGSTVVQSTQDASSSTDVTSASDAVTSPDVVSPPRDVVTPPTDVVSPPRDVVTPPTDVVSPPRDVVTPPTDVVTPPADSGCTVVPEISTCNERVTYSCGIPELPEGSENATLTMQQCEVRCRPAFPNGDRPFSCYAYRSAGGAVIVNCATCAVGRRVEGFTAHSADAHDEVGRYFAVAAQLEAASVVAFRVLGAELQTHGAPEQLVHEAWRAAEDERRHARTTCAIARARGAVPPKVRLGIHEPRDIEAIATENAVEGCVRETFGALVAHYQSAHAREPDVHAAMGEIAEDETRHAALAWSVAEWFDAALDDAARARVRAARDHAVSTLEAELQAEVPEALVRDAGMPPREVALAMLAGLKRARWGVA